MLYSSLFLFASKAYLLIHDINGASLSVMITILSFGVCKQAVARGLKDPSFRVIQNHFAASGNLGDVAAKVWHHACNL